MLIILLLFNENNDSSDMVLGLIESLVVKVMGDIINYRDFSVRTSRNTLTG